MIPKVIHCVWLSGDDKPTIYSECIKSWQVQMPDYEIREWSLSNLPYEVLNHPFVKGAIRYKKWAYATDYIRLWALDSHGGIYMDMDVAVFKPFNVFLRHRFFSSIELNPAVLYKTIKKNEIIGIGIEAAVIGAEKQHPFIKAALASYENLEFINTPEFCFQHIMPRMLTRTAISSFGFRQIPNYQLLREDMHLYPCDVFSSVYNWDTLKATSFDDAKATLIQNPIRYACHLCAHAWFEGTEDITSLRWKIKHLIYILSGAKYWKKTNKINAKI